jgi:hypothetical protein
MVYDRARRRSVLSGGWTYRELFGDTWTWDGATWRRLEASGPPPRHGHAMAYDERRGCVVLFGGSARRILGDTWELAGDRWALRSTSGPSPRTGAHLGYDPLPGAVLLRGGSAVASFDEVWSWDGRAWQQAEGRSAMGAWLLSPSVSEALLVPRYPP